MINYVSWNGLGKYRSGYEGTRHCDLQKLSKIAAARFSLRPQATSDFLLRHRILRSQHLSLAALRRALSRPTSISSYVTASCAPSISAWPRCEEPSLGQHHSGFRCDTVKMDHDAAPHAHKSIYSYSLSAQYIILWVGELFSTSNYGIRLYIFYPGPPIGGFSKIMYVVTFSHYCHDTND